MGALGARGADCPPETTGDERAPQIAVRLPPVLTMDGGGGGQFR